MRRLLLLSTALLAGLPAHAQYAVPETIVSATRIPTPAERVPAAITVLTRTEIEEHGWQTLAEALRTVPGMRLVQSGGLGQNASAFIRGAASRHVLVLLDGVPLNDASEPNGAFNAGNELLGDIERIEIVRGPASSLYGSGALGGVINLVTRRAPPNTPIQGFGEIAGGSDRTARGMLGAAGNTERFDWMVAGQALSTAGQDIVPRRMATHTGDADGLRAKAATARFGVRLDAATRVEALFRWRQNHLQLDDAPFQRLDDPDYWGRDRNWLGSVRAETALAGFWTTGLRVSVTQDRRRYVNQPDVANFSDTDDTYRGERRTVDWGNQLRLGDVGAFSDVGLAFGVTHQRESSDSRSIAFGTVTSTDARADSMAYHAGLQGRLFERLDLSLGVRHDEADGYDGFTSWRAGGVLAVPEIASRLRASAGTGFKAPSLFQRFGVIGTFFRGNPNLRPERSFGWETGIETDVALAGRPDFATFGATYFDQRFRQLINFNPAFDSLENIDRAKARGVEFSATVRPVDWLEASLAWTITETLDEATNRPLPRRPRNVVALSARVEPVRGLVVVPEVLFTGPSLEGAFAAYDDQGNAITVPSYNKSGTVVNLTGSYRVTPQITAFAEGRNVGGSRFEPANGFVTPGRSLVVGTRFVF